MGNFLLLTSVVLAMIVVIAYVNERTTKLTYEIALLLFSVVVGIALTVVLAVSKSTTVRGFLDGVQIFNLEKFLMDGVLCFMLFAGSRNLKLSAFKENARQICVLAFVCTLLGAVFYGLLFYGVSTFFNLGFTLPMCLMVGSIVAPTDPIAATSILKKFGLPKEVGFLMEAESLLNDGVGVALFVCFSGMVTATGGGGFLILMAKEILGAVLIGTAVSLLCYAILFKVKDENQRIFASLLSAVLSFYLCELLGCSGAIACVTCGIVFSTFRDNAAKRKSLPDLDRFDSFWETLDVLLNSVLYVILGLTIIRIVQMPLVARLSLAAIILNFVARFSSIFIGTFFMGSLPRGYDKANFSTLFTWGGLRGGLSIALAMSTSSFVPSEIYHVILGTSYAIVFFTTVVQGLTMKRVYEKISP